jgi:hypothetical protein
MLSGNASLRSSGKDQFHRPRVSQLGQYREKDNRGYHDMMIRIDVVLVKLQITTGTSNRDVIKNSSVTRAVRG